MAGESSQEDRTLPATQRQLDQARRDGNIALSREVPALAGLVAAALLLSLAGSAMAHQIVTGLAVIPASLAVLSPGMALLAMGKLAGAMTAPFAIGVLAAVSASVLLQTGFALRTSALLPDPARLDPRRGLSRLFGTDTLVETAKSIGKVGMFGFAAWRSLSDSTPMLYGAAAWDAPQLADHMLRQIVDVLLTMLALQAAITGADIVWVRYRHAKSLRMTRQQVQQEAQEADGNPHIKGKLRQLRMRRAKRRMLAAVPQAAVVVTNPTHYAIALAYDRGGTAAPRVVAKGIDDVAARIRDVARASGVPLVASPPLARALYKTELDAEIGSEHFKAVAEIISYVWRLRDRPRPAHG